MPIIAYPSNIISFLDEDETKIDVLKCMSILNPKLCIYSNLEGIIGSRRPTKTFIASQSFTIVEIAVSLDLSKGVKDACTCILEETATNVVEETGKDMAEDDGVVDSPTLGK